jgi:tetratricopeptide (TPR) repeat protein
MNALTNVQSMVGTPAAALPLPVPWRDPHTVSREVLREHIANLEQACVDSPRSPSAWTCLAIAYAMDYRVARSFSALERAREIAPDYFWGQFKYAELLYRLRALPKAEQETLRALELAATPAEYSVARRQLQEIRGLIREGTQKPAWTKPLAVSALVSLAFSIGLCLLAVAFR